MSFQAGKTYRSAPGPCGVTVGGRTHRQSWAIHTGRFAIVVHIAHQGYAADEVWPVIMLVGVNYLTIVTSRALVFVCLCVCVCVCVKASQSL